MTVLQALVLGLVQGLGEFLPISSSAHLILVPWLLGWEDHGLALDVALHIGTLVAVLGFYRATWIKMAVDLVQPKGDKKLFLLLCLATIPGAAMGYFGEHLAETLFRSPALIACTLSVMGCFLWWCDRRGRNNQRMVEGVGVKDALLVGIAQGFAIIPGFSRSGTTISAGLLLGLTRESAARFSFFMSVPITLGAIVKKLPDLLRESEQLGSIFWIAIFTSGIVGWAAIAVLVKYVSKRSYLPFVIYRLCLAALIVGFVWFRA